MVKGSSTKSLYDYLENFVLFRHAEFLSPRFAERVKLSMSTKPYSKRDAKQALIYAHLVIVDCVKRQVPGSEPLQALPDEYLSSPRALALAIENDGLRDGMIRGSITVTDAIRISTLDL